MQASSPPTPAASALLVVLGAAAMAAAAYLTLPLPGTEVPQTAQTLAVLLAGVLLGPWRGAGAAALYLAAGTLGAPVFADGAAGVAGLTGPTGGYLLSFVVAAALAGAGARRAIRREHLTAALAVLLGVLLIAHGVILLGGWLRLSAEVGMVRAWGGGVAPFVAGAVVKSVLAALLALPWLVRQRQPAHRAAA